MQVLKTEIHRKAREVPTNYRYNKQQLQIMARALGIPTTDRTRGDLISQIQRKRRHVEIEDEDEIEGEHIIFPTQLNAYTPTTITSEHIRQLL